MSTAHADRPTSVKLVSRPRIEGDREAEILDATLALLAAAGYDRLTMDAVATAAKASKATLYRRWTTKAELVVDALNRAKAAPNLGPADTGSLRADLMAVACGTGGLNDPRAVAVLASIITALHHDDEFSEAFHERFLKPKLAQATEIFDRAKARGEIPADTDVELMAHVLPAIVLHRAFILRLPIDDDTIVEIIDQIVVPAATRKPCTAPTTRKGP